MMLIHIPFSIHQSKPEIYMEQTNLSKPKQPIITIAKWIFTIISLLLVIVNIIDKAIISTLIFILIGFLLLPPLTDFWKSKLPFLNNKFIKGGMLLILFIVAVLCAPDAGNTTEVNDGKQFTKKSVTKSIEDYVTANKNLSIIRNMDLLIDNHNLFNNASIQKWDFDNTLKLNKETRTAIYEPFVGDSIQSGLFLKGRTKENAIVGYKIKFYFDNKNKVKNIEAIVFNGEDLQSWDDSDNIDLSKLLLVDKVESQKALIAQQAAEATSQQLDNEKNEEFKDKCLSKWNGACPALQDLVKDNLRDPDSYKHIETNCINMGDYVLVTMKYKAKNGFGGYDIGIVKAKVSWDCEVLGIVEQSNL